MLVPQNHDPKLLQAGGIAAAIVQNKEAIAHAFVQRVRTTLSPAQQQSSPMTADTVPEFLTQIAIALAPAYQGVGGEEETNVAVQHGVIRAKLSDYSLTHLIKEYQIFREVLAEVLGALPTPPSSEEWRIVHRCIDSAIAEAASAFVNVHRLAREQLSATLTHDLRGPLGAVQNYVELIRRGGEDCEQRTKFANSAMENLKRVNRMIEEVLDANRARAGERLTIKPEQCDLVPLVKEALDEFTTKEGERFLFDGPSSLHGVWDCERLRQALDNLLSNAVKYGSANQPITTRVVTTDSRVQISVHNFGDPISPGERVRLFRAFQRTTSAEQSGRRGWGLGLVMVQAIAEAHGGTVLVESAEGHGTTFTLDVLQTLSDLPSR